MKDKVYVWDLFVRFFHWSLVVLFVISYITGENESLAHIYSGYGIITLLVLRVVWGFIGSKHARFGDFVRKPSVVMQYGRELLTGRAKRYLGHNPLGGAMVLAMIASLSLTTLSGLKLYAVEEGKGPLASATSLPMINSAYADDDEHDDDEHEHEGEGEEFWEEIHEFGVNLMLLLIALHLAGVAYSSRAHNESLLKAMINGYKKGSSD